MSRNISTLAKYALGQFFDLKGKVLQNGKLASPDDFEAEAAEVSRISNEEVFQYTADVRGVWFELDAEKYFCFSVSRSFVSYSSFNDAFENFSAAQLSGATLLFLIRKLKLVPEISNGDDVEQKVVGPARSDEGVYLSGLLDFFPNLLVFKFVNSGTFDSNTSFELLAMYLSTYHPAITTRCKLNAETVESLRRLILEQKAWVHKRNVFDAMTAFHLRHAFLEVYRCLEFAFVLPRTKRLMAEISSSGGAVTESPIDFAKRCADTLGWRRIERDSINIIFKTLAAQDYTNFFSAVSACTVIAPTMVPPVHETEKLNSTVSSVTEKFYDLRNQVAHQFWPSQMREMNDEDWNALIKLTAFCVESYH